MELSKLKTIRAADVYKGDLLAGRLLRLEDGSVKFAYLPNYDGPDVAFSLPKTCEAVTTPHGAVPAFFAGLLPEGHRLSVLQRAIKTSLDDEFSLLLAVGGDTPGDVRVMPEGAEATDLDAALEISSGDTDFKAITDLIDRVGIPGIQNKASASMVNAPVRFGGGSAILKIDPPEHPHLVENEALHLEHAGGLGLPGSKFTVVEDSQGVKGLVVSRFDRVGHTRLALEDATQIMGLPPSAKYSAETAEVILAMKEKASAPAVAARNLYLQFLYAWLTGNGDMHAKNVSLLRSDRGVWAVAPIYDVPCTALYRDMTMALPVAGRAKKIRKRHWDELAESIGLPVRAAESAQKLALRVAESVDLAVLPFQGSTLYGAKRELDQRRTELASLR